MTAETQPVPRMVSTDQRTEDRGAFFGSIQGTLSHLLWGDRTWMSRFAGWEAPPGGIRQSPTLFPDWAALKAARGSSRGSIGPTSSSSE